MELHAFAYLDDIIVIGATLEEHAKNLREVLKRLRKANLRLNRNKCSFFQKSIVYLGHVVSEAGIHTDPGKIDAIRELLPPKNVKELRRCLGIASWYRRFVPKFTTIVQLISRLLRKRQKWTWAVSQQQAFKELKARLTQAPVLACPDFNERFALQTDASNYGLGAVLTQRINGVERVLAYASRRFTAAEENYSTTEKECLAIVWAVRKLRCYLEGYSKWVELVPLRKATTAHLERSFRERILAWFGVPKLFVCDNGTQFTSRAFKTYCNQLGMTLQHTAPYSPQQNPTERANRTVKTMISRYLDGEQSSWDTLLPEISLAINGASRIAMDSAPLTCLGTEAQQPDDKARHLQEIFKVAKANMQRATAEQSRHYNLRRREWKPALGDLVLLRQPHLSKAVEGLRLATTDHTSMPQGKEHSGPPKSGPSSRDPRNRPRVPATPPRGNRPPRPPRIPRVRHRPSAVPATSSRRTEPLRPQRIPRRRSREAAEPVARRRRQRSPTQPGNTQHSEPGTQAEQVTAPGRLRVPRPESSVQAEQVADPRRTRPKLPEPGAQAAAGRRFSTPKNPTPGIQRSGRTSRRRLACRAATPTCWVATGILHPG
ncbi:hypothetical protein ACLKA6_012651 [Drosophila palustris]